MGGGGDSLSIGTWCVMAFRGHHGMHYMSGLVALVFRVRLSRTGVAQFSGLPSLPVSGGSGSAPFFSLRPLVPSI